MMTDYFGDSIKYFEEALEIIKVATSDVEWNYPLDYAVAFEKAEKAIKKQVPEKVIVLN